MKALIYKNPETMALEEYPEPQAADGEVVIKIAASGICGSDMHAYFGHDPRRKPGLVMGHELSGTICASASPLYKPGQKVTVDPLITCGYCDYCRTGRDNLCENRGMVGMSRPGAYAEYMAIPAASVVPIPDDMPHEKAVLTEPASTVVHALNFSEARMLRPLQEQRVLVIGGGAIGILMALLLTSRGVGLLRRSIWRPGSLTPWQRRPPNPPTIMWWTPWAARSRATWPFTRSSRTGC